MGTFGGVLAILGVIALIPALFMTSVTVSYILFAPEGLQSIANSLFNTEIPYYFAVGCGIAVTAICWIAFNRFVSLKKSGLEISDAGN